MDSIKKYRWNKGDLLRYAEGDMTGQEKDRFEKELSENLFLAEALEGILLAGPENSKKSVINIQRKLSTRKKKSGIFLKIAATILFMAVSIWLIRELLPSQAGEFVKQEQMLSSETIMDADEVDSKTLEPKSDKTVNTDEIQSEKIEKTTQDRKIDSPQKLIAPKKEKSAISTMKAEGGEESVKEIEPKSGNKDGVEEQAVERLTEKAADDAEEVEYSKDRITAPAMNRRAASEKESAVGDSSEEDYKAIAREQQMSGFDVKSKPPSSTESYQIPSSIMGSPAKLEGIPVGGKEKFRLHLFNNAIGPAASMRGKIRLVFRLNEEGRATDIRIDQSDCKDCEEEAVRLLKLGPLWVKDTAEWMYTIISFPLEDPNKK